MTSLPRALAALLLPLTLAACNTGTTASTSGPDPTGDGTGAGTGTVLRIDYVGGFTTPTELATRLPVILVLEDGRAFTRGPQIEIYPPPALPSIQQQTLSEGQLEDLVQQALDAGVDDPADLGRPPVADVPTTRIELREGGKTHVVLAFALGMDTGAAAPGVTDAQRERREKLVDFLASAASMEGETTRYVPDAVSAVAEPYVKLTPPGDPLPEQPPIAWPGPALPGTSLGTGRELGCVSAEGEQAAEVLAAARTASATTPWTSGGKTWNVAFRPLLPGETGCTDLLPGEGAGG